MTKTNTNSRPSLLQRALAKRQNQIDHSRHEEAQDLLRNILKHSFGVIPTLHPFDLTEEEKAELDQLLAED